MKLLRLCLVPFAAIVVLLMRLGLPLRFGMIWSSRIGHMAGNMACYLNERDAGLSCGWDIWYHGGQPASEQLDRMLSRVVRIDRTGFARICDLVNQLFAGWERHHITTAQVDRDILNLLGKHPAQLYFTAQEKRRAQFALPKLGIPHGAKWVCLIVRDAAYLPQLAYHRYRDSDVATYAKAALELAERGYYVVRMGIKVAKPLNVKHPRVIDFATNGKHTDFMSMYLAANCAFAISNGTGLDAICTAFRRPVCYANYVPLEYLSTWNPRSLAIWKHHEKDGKRMAIDEIYASGAGMFLTAEQFEEAGITLVDNTPDEIAEVVREMVDDLPSDQSAFWRGFPRSSDGAPLHGEILMRIGSEFLKGYA